MNGGFWWVGSLVIIVEEEGCGEVVRFRSFGSGSKKDKAIEARRLVGRENCYY